jgi:hypothetical protein
MDETTFVQESQADPGLSDLADAIVDEVELGPSPQGSETYDVTVALATIVFYALYRWLKNHFDQQRGLNDLELVRKQLDLVRDDLVKDGVPRDKAIKIVAAMLKSVQAKGLNDTIVQSAMAIIARPGGPLPKP